MAFESGISFEEIERRFNLLPQEINVAIIKALNKTAEYLKKVLSAEVSARERIKLRIIRNRIKIFRAKKIKLSAALSCNFKGIPVTVLGTPYQTKPGAVVGGRLFKGAFVAVLKKDGTPGVYRRKTKERFPLKKERLDSEVYKLAKGIMEAFAGAPTEVETWYVFENAFFEEIETLTGLMFSSGLRRGYVGAYNG